MSTHGVRILDWKLDFVNHNYARQYRVQFQKTLILQSKIALAAVLVAMIFLPIAEKIIDNYNILDLHKWAPVYYLGLWCIIWFILFFSDIKLIHKKPIIFASIAFCGLSYILSIADVTQKSNYLYDPQGYHVTLVVLIVPLVLRLRNLLVFVLLAGALLFQTIIIFATERKQPWHFQIGWVLPNYASFVLALYCGYYLERRIKYDFLRRKLMNFEAQKLNWIVARDASLLRNIFPKNLSDELELQMSNRSKDAAPAAKTGGVGLQKPASAAALQKPASATILQKPGSTNSLINAISTRTVPKHQAQLNHHATQIQRIKSIDQVQDSPHPSRTDSITIRVESKQEVEELAPSQILPSSVPTPGAPTTTSSRPSSRKDMRIPLTASITQNGETPQPPLSSRERFTSLSITIPSQVETTTGDSPPSSPIFSLPLVITSPLPSTRSEVDLPALVQSARFITSAGTPLRTNHEPELHTFLSGAQHSDGSLIALSHSYPNVVVVFADIVGFTSLSSLISPQELVHLLNKLFSLFDDILDTYTLEKIRTVGDAYLCVANMSRPMDNPEEQALQAALKMIQTVASIKDKNLSLRVGVASGPLIAGVTGITKWNYDIFGKPYADATFMETVSSPNCISMTGPVYQACKNSKRFTFQQHDVQNGDEVIERWMIEVGVDTKAPLFNFGGPLIIQFQDDMRDHKGQGLSILAEPEFVQKGMDISEKEILDQTSDSASEISSDLEFSHFGEKFGFTREDLDEEEKRIKNKYVNFTIKFMSPSFEAEYLHSQVEKSYNYISGLLGNFALATFILLLAELCNAPTPSDVSSKVWIIFALIFVLLGAYAAYRRFFDFRPYSHYVAGFAMFLYSFAFVMISYFSPTEIHYMWVVFSALYVSSFVRSQGITIIVVQILITLISAPLAYTKAPGLPEPTRHLTTLLLIVSFSLATQYYMVKSFRMEFIAQKRVKYDTYHQKVAQYRAKLLLRNILPEEIIPKLQPSQEKGDKGGVSIVDLFEQATMMFVNLTNLEELTAELDPANTFQVYNEIFTLFDEATHSLGLEKIKTINTVYMVASGLPRKIDNHATAAVNLAKEIYHITNNYTFPLLKKKIRVRIGIASGPVVAGIIGKKKYAYDCWSDTTNTASRMESNGWNSYAQVTPATYALLQHDKFEFQKRENVFIKGKGNMDTYVLKLSSHKK